MCYSGNYLAGSKFPSNSYVKTNVKYFSRSELVHNSMKELYKTCLTKLAMNVRLFKKPKPREKSLIRIYPWMGDENK